MPPETLHIVTLSICIFTLILAAAALMPKLKQALALMRDAIVMAAFAVLLSLAGFVGWGKVFEIHSSRQPDTQEAFAITDFFDSAGREELDPLPLPTIEDERKDQQSSDPKNSDFTANRSPVAWHASTSSQRTEADYSGWEQ